jgi:iron complex outermembrane receptor protein
MRALLFITCLACILSAAAQTNVPEDSVVTISDVVIRSYESNRKLLQTAAGVALISNKDLQRFSNISLVSAVNTLPGIRMEERSPGSYRFVIRGSLLRSPFGVRNVKFYWNDIPFTDAGGNSYLQSFGTNSIHQLEIIKGPSGSLYGANTGGAVLMYDELALLKKDADTKFSIASTAGSYGLFSEESSLMIGGEKGGFQFNQLHQQSDGYRDHSAMRRDVINLHNNWQLKKAGNNVQLIMMYSDLYYQTPGGITLAQMKLNPRLSRQAAGSIPSAITQQAAIRNKTFLGAVQLNTTIGKRWKNTTSLFNTYTGFKNPSFTTYELRDEMNIGLRTSFSTQGSISSVPVRFVTGAELQLGNYNIGNYNNNRGYKGTLQSHDKVKALQHFYFAQFDADITEKFSASAGLSANAYTYRYARLSSTNPAYTNDKFPAVLLPRFSLLYKLDKYFSAYATGSRGYSAPTVAEVRSSDQNFNGNLKAENGWNYELGLRGDMIKRRVYVDVNAFIFRLDDAITRRLNNAGAEYFVNAGGTDQKGMELLLSGIVIQQEKHFVQYLKCFTSFTYHDFRFRNYIVTNTNYSGNHLTGVPLHNGSIGVDASFKNGCYANIVFNYTHRLPLNDANTVYADPYRLLNIKIGWRHSYNDLSIELFAGADNLLNELYSLGNDINAAGNRYYNPAAGCNYFAGLILSSR